MQIIHKFRKFATLHNVHVTLVMHPRKESEDLLSCNSIFGGAKATQEADNVLFLQEEAITERIKRKYVQVAKNRFSGNLGEVPLIFNSQTLTFSKKYANKSKKATSNSTRWNMKITKIFTELPFNVSEIFLLIYFQSCYLDNLIHHLTKVLCKCALSRISLYWVVKNFL